MQRLVALYGEIMIILINHGLNNFLLITMKKILEKWQLFKVLIEKSKDIEKENKKQIDFVGIYNFLDHLENPLKLFR